MKQALIIEDEAIAALNLTRLLAEVAPDIEICETLQSIEETIDWFAVHSEPDIVFMDIHLADGLSFRIFEHITIHCPIVFTTAYDQYALDAFEVNSIDYLLKPISADKLRHALNKWETFSPLHENEAAISQETMQQLLQTMQHSHRQYQSHFLVPMGEKLQPLPVADIAYIHLDAKIAQACTLNDQHYFIDKPLDTLMELLNPDLFFRANRQFIIAHSAIKYISTRLGSKLGVTLVISTPEPIIISKARATEFKQWFTH
ncbi:MAG: response regulator transcription factor [Bacteroidales bacterium]|nr:response regulator transcription factor [Bacteroidales bacterium]